MLRQAQVARVPAPPQNAQGPPSTPAAHRGVSGVHCGGPSGAEGRSLLPPVRHLSGFPAPGGLAPVPLGGAGQVDACTRRAPSFNLE